MWKTHAGIMFEVYFPALEKQSKVAVLEWSIAHGNDGRKEGYEDTFLVISSNLEV